MHYLSLYSLHNNIIRVSLLLIVYFYVFHCIHLNYAYLGKA